MMAGPALSPSRIVTWGTAGPGHVRTPLPFHGRGHYYLQEDEDQTTTKLYRRDRSLGPGIEQPSAADRLSRQPVTSRQRQRACECMHLDDREAGGQAPGEAVVWTDGGSPLVVQRKLLLLGGRTCRADLLGGGSALLAGPWLPRTTARERTLARHGSGR